MGHRPQRLEALLDLLEGEPGNPLGAELLDVEGGEDGAVAHGPPQAGVVGVSVRAIELAEKAAGETAAGAGRGAALLQREARQREEATFGEQGRSVLALL